MKQGGCMDDNRYEITINLVRTKPNGVRSTIQTLTPARWVGRELGEPRDVLLHVNASAAAAMDDYDEEEE